MESSLKVFSTLEINSSSTSLLSAHSILYDSINASSITCSGIPLLSGQNLFPSFVDLTHCQIVFLYLELLCHLRLDKFAPQNPHSNRQLNAYCLLYFSRFPGVTDFLPPFLRSRISCALAKVSAEIMGSWWSLI